MLFAWLQFSRHFLKFLSWMHEFAMTLAAAWKKKSLYSLLSDWGACNICVSALVRLILDMTKWERKKRISNYNFTFSTECMLLAIKKFHHKGIAWLSIFFFSLVSLNKAKRMTRKKEFAYTKQIQLRNFLQRRHSRKEERERNTELRWW